MPCVSIPIGKLSLIGRGSCQAGIPETAQVSIPIGKLSLIGLDLPLGFGAQLQEFQFPLGS